MTVLNLPDLSVVKTNNVNGQSSNGGSWNWILTIANDAGSGSANFSNGQTILFDALPNTGIRSAAGQQESSVMWLLLAAVSVLTTGLHTQRRRST